MQVTKWLHFTALWLLVQANEETDDQQNPETQNYQYRYYVRDEETGDIKSQEETKQGDVVTGHYTVGEPTGDRRVVTYTADQGGFRADVKYEEGGPPSSATDKEKQIGAKSGYEFHWLPPNPENIQGKEHPVDETKPEDNASSVNEHTTEGSTTEASVETTTISGKEGKSGEDVMTTISPTEPPAATTLATTVAPIPEEKSPTESEQSAEAAESAPQSEEISPPPTPPSQMYLPIISYQNIPFINLPMVDTTPDDNDKSPTIIYASQNFYNPWQWFGNSGRETRGAHITNEHGLYTSNRQQFFTLPRRQV